MGVGWGAGVRCVGWVEGFWWNDGGVLSESGFTGFRDFQDGELMVVGWGAGVRCVGWVGGFGGRMVGDCQNQDLRDLGIYRMGS